MTDTPEWRKPLRERGGHVYFLSDGMAIKIGFSTGLEQRLRNHQGATSLTIELLLAVRGYHADEQHLIGMFSDLRCRGREWFRPDPSLLTYIDELKAVSDQIPRRRPLADFIGRLPLSPREIATAQVAEELRRKHPPPLQWWQQ